MSLATNIHASPVLLDLLPEDTLQEFQDTFADATNTATVIMDPEGRWITQPSNLTDYCKMIRAKCVGACQACDRKYADIVALSRQPIDYLCDVGHLHDFAVPIFVGPYHTATIFGGQMWVQDHEQQPSSEHQLGLARELGLPIEEFREALDAVPTVTNRQFRQRMRLLERVAAVISETAYRAKSLQDHLGLLNMIDRMLVTEEDVERLLSTALEDSMHLLGCHNGHIRLLNPESGNLRVYSVKSEYEDVIPEEISSDDRLLGPILRGEVPYLYENRVQDTDLCKEQLEAASGNPRRQDYIRSIGSVAHFPISVRGRALGVLNVHKPVTDSEGFGMDEINMLAHIAARLGLVLENAQNLDEHKSQIERLNQLDEAVSSLSQTVDIEALPEMILGFALKLFQGESGSVLLCPPGGDAMRMHAASGLPESAPSPFALLGVDEAPIADLARTSGETIVLPSDSTPGVALQRKDQIGRSIVLPLKHSGMTLGILSLNRPLGGDSFDFLDMHIANMYATHAAIALENAETVSKLRHVLEAGKSINLGLQLDETLKTVVDAVVGQTQADMADLWLLEDEELKLYVRVPGTGVGPAPRGLTLSDALPNWEQETGSLHIVQDLHAQTTNRYLKSYKSRGASTVLVAPLMQRGQHIGVLAVASKDVRRFSALDVSLASMLAEYAAIAIENSRVFSHVDQRRIAELETHQKVSDWLSRSLDTEDILRGLLDEGMTAVRSSQGILLLYEQQSGEFQAHVHRGMVRPGDPPAITGKRGAIRRVTRDKKLPHLVKLTEGDPLAGACFYPQSTVLCAPILLRDSLLGILIVGPGHEERFWQDDLKLLHAITMQAGVALEGARMLDVLRRVAGAVGSRDLDELLTELLDCACDLLFVPSGCIWLQSDDGLELELAAARGTAAVLEGKHVPIEGSFIGGVFLRQRSECQLDWRTLKGHEFRDVAGASGLVSVLSVPLVTKDTTIGVFQVFTNNDQDPYSFTSWDSQLLSHLAGQAAISISHQRAQNELLQAEKLTGLGLAATAIAHELGRFAGRSGAWLSKLRRALCNTQGSPPEALDELEHNIGALQKFVEDILIPLRDVSDARLLRVEPIIQKVVDDNPSPTGVRLDLVLAEDLPTVRANSYWLYLTLANLVTNGYRAMGNKGRLRVSVSATQGCIRVDIEDNGVGMDAKLRDKIIRKPIERTTDQRC